MVAPFFSRFTSSSGVQGKAAFQFSAANLKASMNIQRLAFICVFFTCLAGRAPAQLTRGAVLGPVQDPSGAGVTPATLKIVNTATNLERSTTTNSDGLYRFAGVDPGTYTVT